MVTPTRHLIVTATSSLAASFSHVFKMHIPVIAYFATGRGIEYNWRYLEEAKLVIFTGGADINPAIYGQSNRHSSFNAERDTAEVEVLRKALNLGKKILGVCRGHQLINGYLGGSLVQDISSELNVVHENEHHLEILDEGGLIPNVFSGMVNSMHHQGVVKCGEGLTATTYWKGVFESTESRGILTTQFHPEWMTSHDNSLGLDLWDVLTSWAYLNAAIRMET